MCHPTDTYIAKDSSINDEIDKLRLSATAALSERRDVISDLIVYPVFTVWVLLKNYQDMMISLRPGHGERQG